MPNAPWATTNAGPNPSDLYPEPPQGQMYSGPQMPVSMSTPGMEPVYETYWTDESGNRVDAGTPGAIGHSVITGYQQQYASGMKPGPGLDALMQATLLKGKAGGTAIVNRQMLDQLRSVLLGDPTIAQQTLAQMGWTGTVDDFKALTPAQQNVWAHEHAAATKGEVTRYGWNSMYGGFYRDPATGVIDFTKWWDGSPSGYDANMNPTSAATIHPSVAASNKVKQQSLAPMGEALGKAVAQNPQLSKYAGQMGQPVPSTPVQPPAAIQPPPMGTAPGFPPPGEIKIMPAPGRPLPPAQTVTHQGAATSDMRAMPAPGRPIQPPQQPTGGPVSQPDVRIRVPGRR